MTSMTKSIISYAQNREDLLIFTMLKGQKKGFYIDVGANHPVQDSVTKLFYDNGWRGINIEPISKLHKLLEKYRPNDTNINIGVSDKKGTLTLREYLNGLEGWSTFSKDIMNLRGKTPHIDYVVKVETLAYIFRKHRVKEIDFLKVDVEGLEYEVLLGNDWKTYRPKIIIIENTPGEWSRLLEKVDYVDSYFDGLNHYFIRKDLIEKYGIQNYEVLFEYQVLSSRESLLLKKTDQQSKEIINLSSRAAITESKLNSFISHPENVLSVKQLVRSLAKKAGRKISHD